MSSIQLGNLTISRDQYEAWVGERAAHLTFVEFELLYQLAQKAGMVVSRPQLLRAAWQKEPDNQDTKLTVHLCRLRKKIRGSYPWQIQTVTRRGYVLIEKTDVRRPQPDTPTGESRRVSHFLRVPRGESA